MGIVRDISMMQAFLKHSEELLEKAKAENNIEDIAKYEKNITYYKKKIEKLSEQK